MKANHLVRKWIKLQDDIRIEKHDTKEYMDLLNKQIEVEKRIIEADGRKPHVVIAELERKWENS